MKVVRSLSIIIYTSWPDYKQRYAVGILWGTDSKSRVNFIVNSSSCTPEDIAFRIYDELAKQHETLTEENIELKITSGLPSDTSLQKTREINTRAYYDRALNEYECSRLMQGFTALLRHGYDRLQDEELCAA
ncbi:hypothetical protein HYZ97_01440 [Candidatus Pacearchaeota archaeon]|nr:hypothetical protein [Candidatus Pacearchaeota archaeon]